MENLIEGEASKGAVRSARHARSVIVIDGKLSDVRALRAVLEQQKLVIIDQLNGLDVVMTREGTVDGISDGSIFEIKTRQPVEDYFLTEPMIEPNNLPYWRQFSGRRKKASRW